MNIENMIIEVTRKCQFKCQHCLRGASQNKDLNNDYIDLLLEKVNCIGSITFSGGEPSLNVSAINRFLNVCEKNSISVGSFYISTNGKDIPIDFVVSCIKLYSYCDEKECCAVRISNDYYHQIEGKYDTTLLDALSFSGRKNLKEGSNDFYLLKQGFATTTGSLDVSDEGFVVEGDRVSGEVYLNALGEIISGCDWSYENQKNHKVCSARQISLEAFENYIPVNVDKLQ